MPSISYVFGTWLAFGPPRWIDPILALVAVACGIIVGVERQQREKPAGLRTLALVCLGSAAFTMMSFAFTTTTGDSGRVAAQIVTGIGFLGAGVILHGQRMVTGLTTAALIWVTAAIGMAVGAGYVVAALALSILVNRVLIGIYLYETRWHPQRREVVVVFEYALKGGVTRIRLERVLVDYDLDDARAEWSVPAPELGRLKLTLRFARVHLYELLAELADVPDIVSVKQDIHPQEPGATS